MSSIRLAALWLMWRIFNWPSIILFDHDEEMNARIVKGTKSYPIAQRHGMGVRAVRLLDDGTTTGACYVKRWEPLFPPPQRSDRMTSGPQSTISEGS